MFNTVWNFSARIIFFVLQLVVPKVANSIVVTTHRGHIFGDNSKSFFIHAQSISDLKVYLLTKNKTLFDTLNSEFPDKVLYAWSFRGLLKYIQAKIVVVTHGPGDFIHFILFKQVKRLLIYGMEHQ